MLLGIPPLVNTPLVLLLGSLLAFAFSLLHRPDLSLLCVRHAEHTEPTVGTSGDLTASTILAVTFGRGVGICQLCLGNRAALDAFGGRRVVVKVLSIVLGQGAMTGGTTGREVKLVVRMEDGTMRMCVRMEAVYGSMWTRINMRMVTVHGELFILMCVVDRHRGNILGI